MKYSIKTTAEYDKWFRKIKETSTKIKILARLARVENGNFGDHKQLSDGLYELRIFFGPGYRIYYTIRQMQIILLLIGGDKSSQQKDIDRASTLLKETGEDI